MQKTKSKSFQTKLFSKYLFLDSNADEIRKPLVTEINECEYREISKLKEHFGVYGQ